MAEKSLKGKEVVLRPLIWKDLDDYSEWEKVHDFIYSFPKGDFEKSDLKEILVNRIEDLEEEKDGIAKPPYLHLEIDNINGKHIGWVRISRDRKDEPHHKEFEVFIMEKRDENVDILREIIELWVDYIFKEKGYTRIGFTTWEGNKTFITASKKLGFIEEGRIREGVQINEKIYDTIRMGILLEEWRERGKNGE